MTLPRLNRLQGYGLAGTAGAWLLLLILHNPLAGYTTSFYRFDAWALPGVSGEGTPVPDSFCAVTDTAQREILSSQKSLLGQELGRCEHVELAPLQWHSNGALIRYAGTLRQVLILSGAILWCGLAWLWLFRDPPPAQGAAA